MPQQSSQSAAAPGVPDGHAGAHSKLKGIGYSRIKLSMNGRAISGSGTNVYVVENPFSGGTQSNEVATIGNGKLVSEIPVATSATTEGAAVGPKDSVFFPLVKTMPPTIGVYTSSSQKYSDFTQAGTEYFTGAIATASDKSIWSGSIGSTEEDCYIARSSASGKTQEFSYGSYAAGRAVPVSCEPPSIVQGSDSRMWWPDGGPYVYKNQSLPVSPSVYAATLKGTITQYPLPTTKLDSRIIVRWLFSLSPSTDGNLWGPVELVVCYYGYDGGCTSNAGCEVLRMTTAGIITEFPLENTSYAEGCGPPAAVDHKGDIWMPTFGPRDAGGFSRSYIARCNRDGRIKYFKFLPFADMQAGSIVNAVPYTDSAGYMYFSYENTTTNTGYIIRVRPDDG